MEDGVFRAATEYALAERLPVIYLAANSGARVGLSTEIKECMKVWLDAVVHRSCTGLKYCDVVLVCLVNRLPG